MTTVPANRRNASWINWGSAMGKLIISKDLHSGFLCMVLVGELEGIQGINRLVLVGWKRNVTSVMQA